MLFSDSMGVGGRQWDGHKGFSSDSLEWDRCKGGLFSEIQVRWWKGCSSIDSLHWDGSKGTLLLMAYGRIGLRGARLLTA